MSAAPDVFAVASWDAVVRPRSLVEARAFVAAFNEDRAASIERVFAELRGDGVQDTERERLRREVNRLRREQNRQAGNKELRDAIDRGAKANPLTVYAEESAEWREWDSLAVDAYAGGYRGAERSELAILRDEAERVFDERMADDAAWCERERTASELASRLREFDDPFGDDPPVGVFGFVPVDVASMVAAGHDPGVKPARKSSRRIPHLAAVPDESPTDRTYGGGFVGYVRVSTARQGDSGLGQEAQEEMIRQYASFAKLEVSGFASEVMSGAAGKRRPVFEDLVARCKRGEMSGIIVAKLDRLGRSGIALMKLAEDAKQHGFRVIIASDALTIPGESANDRMFLNVLYAMAEWERDTISERTIDALASAKARGKVLGPPRRLQAVSEARVRELRAAGMGFSAIARQLNEESVPSASGKPWIHTMVRAVFRNDS
ncbi:recombinase family protein [bacterium]|nr:recombinase family protein [bacterium]